MIATEFPQANARFGPPPDLAESQCTTTAKGGSLDGSQIVVVAWKPDAVDLARLNAGEPIFLSMMGDLAPHFLTTRFEEAINPA